VAARNSSLTKNAQVRLPRAERDIVTLGIAVTAIIMFVSACGTGREQSRRRSSSSPPLG
jgi:hypothetical protein